MINHTDINPAELHNLIRQRLICFGGNRTLKIYGTLHCKSGKRLKAQNRVFFNSEHEALHHGYRPCGHCMGVAYKAWVTQLK